MYGNPPVRHAPTTGFSGRSTDLPIDLVKHLKFDPVPVTISGVNQVTFTLNGSVTTPAVFWNGDEPVVKTSTVAYTWVSGSNTILDSAGASAALTGSTLGVWYMYINAAGDTLFPSQTAPSFVEGPSNAGPLGHPGTSRTQFYRYVGLMWCTTAATPVFLAAEKIGYTYHFLDLSNPTTATTWTVTSLFSVRIPKLSKHGMTVRGFLETGAGGTVEVSGSTTSIRGSSKAGITAPATGIIFAPFECPADDATGELYALHATAAGDIHITQIVDIV